MIEDGKLDDLRKFQKQLTDTISQRSKKCIDHAIIEKDALSDALLPGDVPLSAITRRHLYPAKTLGNGDCLYNAVSISLRGDETLANDLRALTAAELYINAEYYTRHPHITLATSNPEFSVSAENMHALLLTAKGSKAFEETGNFKEAVFVVANETCTKGSWSTFIHLLALSSSLKRNIWSVYPMSNKGIRPLFHSMIDAGAPGTIYVMWSRDGDLDNRHGSVFQPNHFVPLLERHSDFDDEDDEILSQALDFQRESGTRVIDKLSEKDEAGKRTNSAHETVEYLEKNVDKNRGENTLSEKQVPTHNGKDQPLTASLICEDEKENTPVMPIDDKAITHESKNDEIRKLDVHVKCTEVKETEPSTSSEACSPGCTNTVRGPCETICKDGEKKSNTEIENQTDVVHSRNCTHSRQCLVEQVEVQLNDEASSGYQKYVITNDIDQRPQEQYDLTEKRKAIDGSKTRSQMDINDTIHTHTSVGTDSAVEKENEVILSSNLLTDKHQPILEGDKATNRNWEHEEMYSSSAAEDKNKQSKVTHEVTDNEMYSTEDELTLAEVQSLRRPNVTTSKTYDASQTDTDDDIPLLKLLEKEIKGVGKKTISFTSKASKVEDSLCESDSSLSDNSEYESDNNLEYAVADISSSTSTSGDESDTTDIDIDDTHDPYNIQWTSKLQTIKEKKFCGPKPGPIRQLSMESKPLDYFFEVFPEHLFDIMTTSTHAYVPIYQACKQRKDPTWTDKFYKHVTVDIIKAYIGIRMLMALDPKPCLPDYWSTNPSLRNERIASTMSRDRFANLQRYFHINDPTKDPSRMAGEKAKEAMKRNPLYKVSPLMEGVRQNSKRLYNLHQQLSVDEAMIKCHGQHWGIVGAPNKPAKRGFKIFVLADGVTGYTSDFMVYLRRQKETGLTKTVVETLVEGIEDRHHIVFIDKFYTSVPLAVSLHEKGTYLSGSFNTGRKYWPTDLKVSKQKKKKDDKVRSLKRGESMARQSKDGQLLATVWRDKKHVYNLNSYYDPLYNRRECTVERKERNQEGKWSKTLFPCPKPIVEFNKYMGGVDRHDHLRSNYSLQRSCTRWWTYFAWFALDLALINAFVIYKHQHPKAKHKKFHLKVAEQLLAGFSDRKRSAKQTDSIELLLSAPHEAGEMNGRARACRLCRLKGHKTAKGRPKETKHGCMDCKVNLHRDCFAEYHNSMKRKVLTLDKSTQTGDCLLTPTKLRVKGATARSKGTPKTPDKITGPSGYGAAHSSLKRSLAEALQSDETRSNKRLKTENTKEKPPVGSLKTRKTQRAAKRKR